MENMNTKGGMGTAGIGMGECYAEGWRVRKSTEKAGIGKEKPENVPKVGIAVNNDCVFCFPLQFCIGGGGGGGGGTITLLL